VRGSQAAELSRVGSTKKQGHFWTTSTTSEQRVTSQQSDRDADAKLLAEAQELGLTMDQLKQAMESIVKVNPSEPTDLHEQSPPRSVGLSRRARPRPVSGSRPRAIWRPSTVSTPTPSCARSGPCVTRACWNSGVGAPSPSRGHPNSASSSPKRPSSSGWLAHTGIGRMNCSRSSRTSADGDHGAP
jgi:hypothetical protein